MTTTTTTTTTVLLFIIILWFSIASTFGKQPSALLLFDEHYDDEFGANKLRLKEEDARRSVRLKEPSGRRNHGCAVVGTRLINVLGRWAESVESVQLEGHHHHEDELRGCADGGACDLNHVVAVPVADGTIWVPCGFEGHRVGNETSTRFARVVNPLTLEVTRGPALDVGGGACAALALELEGSESVCAFGGTDGSHDDGTFLQAVRCYDRKAGRWWKAFEPLPFGLDHGNAAKIDAGACGEEDPARVLIMNFRTEHFSNMRTEIFASDLTPNPKRKRSWYLYSNDTSSLPRDAGGIVVVDGGRYVVNFGGVFYAYAASRGALFEAERLVAQLKSPVGCASSGRLFSPRRGHHVRVDFAEIRVFDVCRRAWLHVDRMPYPVFATQSCRSKDYAYTCGGRRGGPVRRRRRRDARGALVVNGNSLEEEKWLGGDHQNTRECHVRRIDELERLILKAVLREEVGRLRNRQKEGGPTRGGWIATAAIARDILRLRLALEEKTPSSSGGPRRLHVEEGADARDLQRRILEKFGASSSSSSSSSGPVIQANRLPPPPTRRW